MSYAKVGADPEAMPRVIPQVTTPHSQPQDMEQCWMTDAKGHHDVMDVGDGAQHIHVHIYSDRDRLSGQGVATSPHLDYPLLQVS